MFKKHITRFISIIFIVIVAVGFISGIGTSTDKIKYSMTDYYKAQNVSDLVLRSTSLTGFSESQLSGIDSLKETYGANNVSTGVQLDIETEIDGEKQTVRLCFLDGYSKDEWTVNVPDIIDGKMPSKSGEILCEKSDNKIRGFSIGAHISLSLAAQLPKIDVEIAGIALSPLTFANDGEPSDFNDEDMEVPDTIDAANALDNLDNILYLPSSLIPKNPFTGAPLIFTNAVYLSFNDKDKFNAFDKKYDSYLEQQKSAVSAALELDGDNSDVKILTLKDNYSFVSLSSYADKVMGIGLVLMVAFIFVTALVAQSTMTRLMEEERAQIACLRTLGYSSFKIVFKYVLFAMIAAGIGGVASYFVGLGLAHLIYYVFNYSFTMPPVSSTVALPFYLIVFFVIVAITLLATLIAGLKLTNETPANLLRPKPPQVGKKEFLEKIPFIWNALSFK